MVGMKSGSGDDPFAEEDDNRAGDEDDREPAEESSAAGDDPFEAGETVTEEKTSRTNALPGVPEHPADGEHALPWIHRRDGVKDDRSHKTIHYTEHTLKRERRELIGALEDELGEDVELTDAREAAYLVGMDHVEDVANLLREWGYAIE